ncbi:hypothetical protein N658DRAFT_234052 [Parathielavia hyrcaniae]|uniref:Uncharacterized protein n=1 Tax=Parathielavia hyrcaniae TaxID=113614 RepID=A0AAN6T4L6_9PEZI|nr:hypothetical protein N658DRAFT_234052 [Parathielavia hyrcaniae]
MLFSLPIRARNEGGINVQYNTPARLPTLQRQPAERRTARPCLTRGPFGPLSVSMYFAICWYLVTDGGWDNTDMYVRVPHHGRTTRYLTWH